MRGYLRRYLLLFASNKSDVRVGTRTFQHLLRLPLAYFERCSAGIIVKHMQQSEGIREFLAGRLFLTLLDALSLLVFVPLPLSYSAKLTLIVLGFALMVALLVAVTDGPYKRRLKALYESEALRQGLIVETVHGMRTVKSLAIEPPQRRSWGEQLAHVVQLRF
jgi:ATP-binding cassette, subfamily B, bacterial HlyB/CyaB